MTNTMQPNLFLFLLVANCIFTIIIAENVAAEKEVTSSSLHTSSIDPQKLVNGELERQTIFQTKEEMDPWIEINLKEGIDIDLVVVYNQFDDPKATFPLSVSINGTFGEYLCGNKTWSPSESDSVEIRFNCNGSNGHVLRVQHYGRAALRLHEVQVYEPGDEVININRYNSERPEPETGNREPNKVEVTEDNVELNKEVVQGRDWTGGLQDGGKGGIGVIEIDYEDGWVAVRWTRTSLLHDYRVGDDDQYELYYAGEDEKCSEVLQCPIQRKVGQWSEWTAYSKSCGIGRRERYRTCKADSTRYCVEFLSQVENHLLVTCPPQRTITANGVTCYGYNVCKKGKEIYSWCYTSWSHLSWDKCCDVSSECSVDGRCTTGWKTVKNLDKTVTNVAVQIPCKRNGCNNCDRRHAKCVNLKCKCSKGYEGNGQICRRKIKGLVVFSHRFGIAGASSEWDNRFSADKAFGYLADKGYWHPKKYSSLPQSIWYQFKKPIVITKFKLYAGKYFPFPLWEDFYPRNLTFFASNNADNCSKQEDWAYQLHLKAVYEEQKHTYEIEIDNNVEYSCYGFLITGARYENKWAHYTAIQKIEFWKGTDEKTTHCGCVTNCATECQKTIMGLEYRGNVNSTKTGHSCKAWAATMEGHQTMPEKYPTYGLTSNYCRNPTNYKDGPWCYVVGWEMLEPRWERCEICHDTRIVEFRDISATKIRLTAGPAKFGPNLATRRAIHRQAVKVDPFNACDNINNKLELRGKIAIIGRGNCLWIEKARAVEQHGAKGGIFIDNIPTTSAASEPTMFMGSSSSSDNVSIPFVFLYHQEGESLLNTLSTNPNLIVTMADNKTATTLNEVIDDIEYWPTDCGRVQNGRERQKRVVGGQTTLVREQPWVVQIQRLEEGLWKHRCGGTLIGHKIVISAAHCFDSFLAGSYSENDFRVVTGQQLTLRQDHGEQSHTISENGIIIHKDYDETYENDVAILKLSTDVTMTEVTQPACLPNPKGEITKHEKVTSSGYGVMQTNGAYSDELRSTRRFLRVMSNSKCKKAYYDSPSDQEYGNNIKNSHLCALDRKDDSRDCSGDSGGPLVAKKDSKFVVVGIVSWGSRCSEPISSENPKRLPSVYQRVSCFLEWIHKSLGRRYQNIFADHFGPERE